MGYQSIWPDERRTFEIQFFLNMKNTYNQDRKQKQPYLVITLDKADHSYCPMLVLASDEDEAAVMALEERADQAGADIADYKDGEFDDDGGRDGILSVLVLAKREVDEGFANLTA